MLNARTLSASVLVLAVLPASASCVLPVPDGDGPQPSKPNLYGRIDSVGEGGTVIVSQSKGGTKVAVLLPPGAEIYSAFGGDVCREELAPGQTVWVWFEGCKWPSSGRPAVSAYFRVYSKDPHDRP
jgi:hypothetical protein